MKKLWLLSALLIIASSVFAGKNNQDLTAEEFNALVKQSYKNKNIVLIDIRTKAEFDQGHIDKALNLDFYAPDFKQQLDKLNRNKHYIIYCRSGNRTGQTLVIMNGMKFKKVQHLAGGINSWIKAGLPLVK